MYHFINSWNYCTNKLIYLCLHLIFVWRKRCILWLDFVDSVGNFAVERVCSLYSDQQRSSVFSWRINVKIYPSENRANINLFSEFGDTKCFFPGWVGLGLGSLCYLFSGFGETYHCRGRLSVYILCDHFFFFSRYLRVYHHTCVVKYSFVFLCRWIDSFISIKSTKKTRLFVGSGVPAILPRIKITAREGLSQCSAQVKIQCEQ